MRYDSLGLILTNKCNAVCDHCCFSCSPAETKVLPSSIVFSCIKDSKNIPEITQIGFSGGEPFLIYDNLLEYVSLVQETGRGATVTTNCQWATTYDIAYEKLKSLKVAGLIGLGISYDEFHQKFVDKNNLLNTLQAAKALGLSTKVQAAVLKDTKPGDIINKLWPDIIDIAFSAYSCYPVGRAKEKISGDCYIRNTLSHNRFCRKSSTFSIDVNGDAWPCCVPAINETELSIGNVFDVGVEQIYKNLKENVFLKLLRNRGFDYFIEIAREDLHLDIPQKVISSCELCMKFFSSENFYRFIPFLRKRL